MKKKIYICNPQKALIAGAVLFAAFHALPAAAGTQFNDFRHYLSTASHNTPSVGVGYADIGLTGHSGRPGISINAGNLYNNNVIASGSASFAHGYYGVNADLGKLIHTNGTVSFEPYLSLGFISMNDNQQETGFVQHTGQYFSYSTPYSYIQPRSIQDFYGLAGVNLNVPIGGNVTLGFGGGYGHTLSTYGGGNGGAVYKGEAEAAFGLSRRWSGDLNVSYLHLPGASLTSCGAGVSYHF